MPLPESSPSAQGVDARGVAAFVDELDASRDIEPHSLMVLRHGHVVASGWWAPYSADRPHLLYSLSKSVTSTAVGLAVSEDLLALDDLVVAHFPEYAGEITDPRVRAMRVRHLLAMATGHDYDTWERAVAGDRADPVRGFLQLAPQGDPGSVFAYNQSATYTLAAIVQRAAGCSLGEYLRPRLLDPLGIGPVGWQQFPAGRDLGFSGLHATTDAVARLGLLYLQRGRWDGRRLLPADWVDEATRKHVDNSVVGEGPDWQQGYGFQFWMARHGYRGDGAYGQFCVVLPEQDAVVAVTAATVRMQAVLDAMWQHLLPAFGRAGDPTDDAALRERLAGLSLPVPALTADPVDPTAWFGVGFEPFGGTCPQQPSLLGVGVSQEGDRWVATLRERDDALTLPLAAGRWSVREPDDGQGYGPTAAAGGWVDDDTFRLEVIFLETPHRLVVTCRLADRTFRARWATVLLWPGPLGTLRAPLPLR